MEIQGQEEAEINKALINFKKTRKLPSHEKYELSSCFNKSNSNKYKNITLTTKDFYSNRKRIRGEQNNCEKDETIS